ncbi:hypothetical protein BpHYR1_034899 [Brachionus plicatilis]|uniref:Uncharacterized protein n=1 Tax=Brachionus plicatilis TaxID=10195 RepID=A0A3M7Q348_BRAPC|nr:hypothetical protein BpHYR1_034899 [Brachionus plicatilis]
MPRCLLWGFLSKHAVLATVLNALARLVLPLSTWPRTPILKFRVDMEFEIQYLLNANSLGKLDLGFELNQADFKYRTLAHRRSNFSRLRQDPFLNKRMREKNLKKLVLLLIIIFETTACVYIVYIKLDRY